MDSASYTVLCGALEASASMPQRGSISTKIFPLSKSFSELSYLCYRGRASAQQRTRESCVEDDVEPESVGERRGPYSSLSRARA
ncbi:MAG: hypothetical protein QW405_01220, partial [Fervidicoccaceae archaeon]